ncbi:uncharacterized protein DMENIID0001_170610 [Sergentomyia squamirostris]
METLGRGGYYSVLGRDIEMELVEWIIRCTEYGFPVNKEALYSSVEKLINIAGMQVTQFRNNRPSETWIYAFLRRHPEIDKKKAEYVNRARGSVTEEKLRAWFPRVMRELGEENVDLLKDSSRVFYMDESGFNLSPNGEIVLAPRKRHTYIESQNNNKDNITTLFSVNAAGDIAPPLTLFKYERLPSAAYDTAPEGWGVERKKKRKVQERRAPCVLTSDSWIEFREAEQEDKIKKEKEKEDRKCQREHNKIMKQEEIKRKKMIKENVKSSKKSKK